MFLDGQNIVKSSIQQAPLNNQDWLRPFVIGTVIEQSLPPSRNRTGTGIISWFLGSGDTSAAPPTKSMEYIKWMSLIMSKLFDSSNSNDDGLFTHFQGSVRIHPNLASKRKPDISLEEMEFAGSLVAKYIVDSLVYGTCLDMTRIKFSKSFLATLVGLPITYEVG